MTPRPTAILIDIEGTTSAIAFVKDTLFPFAAAALDGFLADHAKDPVVAALLAEVRDLAPGQDPATTLRGWMATDAKVTPLKTLQGLIWEDGFSDGRLSGHLWPDVAPCLRAWSQAGLRLYVYSSGSARAQKRLFGHSVAGDLSGLFGGFFDTTVGAKRDSAAYGRIATGVNLAPGDMLFLSDIAEECDAAVAAGMLACRLVRPADGTQPGSAHPEAADFPGVARLFHLPRPG